MGLINLMDKRRVIRIVIVIISILILGGSYYAWNHSLFGNTLVKPTIASNGSAISEESQNSSEGAKKETPNPTSVVSGNSDGISCGSAGPMNVFVLGIDRHEQSDAIRLINIDYLTPKVTLLSIPRDLWVQIPNLENQGINEGRINSAYGYGEYYLGKGEGVNEFAATISKNFDITFDHYLVLYDTAFVSIVDEIGGIDITLTEPVDGTNQPFDGTREYLPYFAAGTHHMDGITALKFIKIRYQDSDLHRVDRQSQVIMEIYRKLMQPGNQLRIPKLVFQMLNNHFVTTDLSLADFSQILCFARNIESSDINFRSLPNELYSGSISNEGGDVLIPSSQVAAYIQGIFKDKSK